jgi:hypothetical protein
MIRQYSGVLGGVVLAFIACAADPCTAEVVRYNFTGTVTYGAVCGQFHCSSVGDPVFGSFSYDPSGPAAFKVVSLLSLTCSDSAWPGPEVAASDHCEPSMAACSGTDAARARSLISSYRGSARRGHAPSAALSCRPRALQRAQAADGAGLMGRPTWGAFMIG